MCTHNWSLKPEYSDSIVRYQCTECSVWGYRRFISGRTRSPAIVQYKTGKLPDYLNQNLTVIPFVYRDEGYHYVHGGSQARVNMPNY